MYGNLSMDEQEFNDVMTCMKSKRRTSYKLYFILKFNACHIISLLESNNTDNSESCSHQNSVGKLALSKQTIVL